MKKIFKGLGLGFVALALSLSLAGSASATLTVTDLSVASNGALTLTGAVGSAVNLGTTITTGAITVGATGQTGAVTIFGAITGGANALFDNSTTSNVSIGAALLGGTLNIGGTGLNTGTVTIAGGTGAQAINIGGGGTGIKTIGIGTGAIGNVITIGTVTGAASVTIKAGSAGILLGGSTATPVTANGAFNYAGTSGGAADVQTATITPAPTALTTGMIISFKSGFTNATTTPTFNLNGLGAVAIVKRGAAAVAAGDILVNGFYVMIYNGATWNLINPVVN